MIQIAQPGELVAGRFLIVRFIAEGGMGEVYEAEDQVLGERVALKFLSRRNVDDERVQRRFRREIQLARKVTHANVCRIYDVFQHLPPGARPGTEVTFVTMELLSGETLEEFLERRGRLREIEALPIVRQMAEGLAAAHAAGVIHRDFKSSNVMLVSSPSDPSRARVVITDFGLARSMTHTQPDTSKTPLTGEMHIVGTADYMAPEQLYGEAVSPASDVYALGVVMFEMVTGEKPYKASNPMSLLAKRVAEPPASPRDFVPDLDERWVTTIDACLVKDPAERIASPWDVLVSLLGEDATFNPQTSGTISRPLELQQAAAERARTAAVASRAGQSRKGPPGGMLTVVVLALVVALVAIWWRRPDPAGTSPLGSFNPERLTTSPGFELDPTFSPDGTALAYSSDRSGTFEIWIRHLGAGGEEVQLTFDGDQLFEPAWSPDGDWIACHSRRRGGVWIVPAGGGDAVQLAEFGSRPAWSPDGSTLAFQSESSPQLAETTAPALALSTLWTVARDGAPPRQLTQPGSPPGSHASPTWSPDGRRLVFTASRYGASEIWALEVATREIFPLALEPATSSDPTFAPNGRSLYFSARDRQVNGLWRLPLVPRTGRAAGEPMQIANLGLASIRQLALSPDGRQLAYTTASTMSNLWALPMDPATALPAGEAAALTTGSGRANRPAFAPGGQRLAFDHWQPGVPIDLWVMDKDGRNAAQVTSDGGDSSQASWPPGGDRLVYHASRDGQRGLWEIDLTTRRESFLAELPEDVFWARLSPDGGRVAYHSRQGSGTDELWTMTLATGERLQLTSAAESMAFPCWSNDGEWLAFQRQAGGGSQVMVVPSAGGEPRALTDDPGDSWPFSFSPDSDKVAFAASRDGEWSLRWVSRTTGEERRLTPPPRLNEYLRYPAWSPAGDRLVYELAQTTGDIFLVKDRF